MKQLKTLAEATEAFLAYSPPGMTGHYQLDRIQKLLAFLDNPQEKFKTIHIAGTSGKTSTAYFTRGLLEAAGMRTGLTVSPHIVAINERVQIGGVPLDEARFLTYTNRFLPLVRESKLQPTYFELLVALAYWVFANEKIDYAVVETGLGGLLDGTNTISLPDKVCIITDIGLDHTEILGDTLTKIATQKAGIIQPYNHVIVRQQSDEALRVIIHAARAKQATYETVAGIAAPSTLPVFQHRNWAMAIAAYEYVAHRDALPMLTDSQLVAVARQTPPGRWEIYTYRDKTIILDGAHNPQKMQALSDSLASAGIVGCAVLANFTEGPDTKINTILELLQPYTTHLIIPEFRAGQDLKSRRSRPATQLAADARAHDYVSIEEQPNLSRAVQLLLARPEKILLITGSLYLVSAVRPIIRDLLEE